MDKPKCRFCGARHSSWEPHAGVEPEIEEKAPASRTEGGTQTRAVSVLEDGSPAPNRSVSGKPKFDRNEYHKNYMRDYMRRKRAELKRLRELVEKSK